MTAQPPRASRTRAATPAPARERRPRAAKADGRAAFDAGQLAILERVAQAAPLGEILESIVRLIERQADGMLCTILLLDRDRGCVRPGAAPSLPEAYTRALDGARIGPEAGSCGAAAYRGERVIVEDIETHPFWANWKHLALPHGLRACWSSPIFSSEHEVLGTYAIYYREPRGPSAREIVWVDAATHLAAIAILRERSEQELRQSEARYRQLVDTAYEGVWTLDANGITTFANRRMGELLGYTAEEMVGRGVFDFIDPSLREQALTALARRTQGVSEQHEFRLRRRDGSDLWTIIAGSPIVDADGRHAGSLGMVTDLTERRRMEEEVRGYERLRSFVLAHVVDCIFCLTLEEDGGFRFATVNAAFLRATGLEEQQVVGKRVEDVIPLPARTMVLERYREAIRERRPVSWEEVSAYPAGVKYGEVTVVPIVDDDGSCTNLVGAVHDVTARRTAEEERRAVETRLAQSQRLQSVGTMVGGIAHDFNNFLTAIRGRAELGLSRVPESGAARDTLAEIVKACERASGLVRQILTFTRPQVPERNLLDLTDTIDEALHLLRASMPKGVSLRARLDPETPPILGDATQIHQVVMNLCANAAHASIEARGAIEVSCGEAIVEAVAPLAAPDAPDLPPGRYARISVRDEGKGMDRDALARAFEPFFTTKPPGEGTGLGLWVVQGVVKSHGGAISVESEPGRGTTVTVHLPAAAAARAAVAAASAAEGALALPDPPRVVARAPATTPAAETGDRVLFVDDEQALVFFAERALRRLGYRVTAHSDPLVALRDFRSRPAEFDVVLTDSNMPGLSGTALAREVRRIRPDLPVVMITGLVRPEDALAAREIGIDDVLLKPSAGEDFGQFLHRVIRARRPKAPPSDESSRARAR